MDKILGCEQLELDFERSELDDTATHRRYYEKCLQVAISFFCHPDHLYITKLGHKSPSHLQGLNSSFQLLSPLCLDNVL